MPYLLPRISKLTPFERIVLAGPSQKGLVSDIYRILNKYNMDIGEARLHAQREWVLEEELSVEQWGII